MKTKKLYVVSFRINSDAITKEGYLYYLSKKEIAAAGKSLYIPIDQKMPHSSA
jgi:hypothetical protein